LRDATSSQSEPRSFAGWVRGEHLGLDVPAEPADLHAGGPAFLTQAFRVGGALPSDNAVASIKRFDELAVGGTGRKLILSVSYERPDSDLPTELFVKFSRNSQDPARDRLRHHMREEIMLALVSRSADFPLHVPRCMFADFDEASGTGILITERVRYGEGGVEPCHVKCQDYDLDDALDRYRTIVRALAALAAAFKADALPAEVHRYFPAGSPNIFEKYRVPPQDAVSAKIDAMEAFGKEFPELLFSGSGTGLLFDKIRADLRVILPQEREIRAAMLRDGDYVSLCHFNVNIDNAWFWKDEAGKRHCGLLDWGMVGQMHVAQALWGSLSGAEPEIWDDHLDELIGDFVERYRVGGGPLLDADTLREHLMLLAVFMGLASLLDAPARILHEIPGLRPDATRFDPEFGMFENARVQLHVLNNVLRIWERLDLSRCACVTEPART
jgi:hypothetical protein